MLPPETLIHDRYCIIDLVGQGAMGAVYKAIDQRIGQPVALKQTLTADPAAMDALEREALILAGLSHPALPTVSDTFADPLGQFLVMTYVPGPNLADLLAERGRAFAPATVLAWADQLLDALVYLHQQSPPVLHRDIKPQNLKLTPAGDVVLLDFGLARGATFQTRVAGQRSVVGYTLAYAPIEQVRGTNTDPRSDLFALAGTLYHLLIGAPPPDALERAAARIAGQPDPLKTLRARYPELPAPAAEALDRCLRLDPAERIGSAEELIRRLHQAQVDPADPVAKRPVLSPEPRPRRLTLPVTALLAAALVGGGVALRAAGVGPNQVRAVAPSAIPVATFVATPILPSATARPGSMYAPPLRQQPAPGARAGQGLRLEVTCEQGGGQDAFAVSPDGELVAISCQSGVEISLAATGRRVMSLPYHATTFAFDPQDTMLAVASNTNEVQLLSTSKSQAPRTISLFSNVSATALAFSPDNSKIAIVGSDGRVLFVDVASGKVLPDTLTNSTPITKIAFAPNGGYFATASSDEIRIWELVGDTYGLYANNGASDLGGVVSLAFSSDSAELLVGSAAAGARRYDVLDSKRETSLADSSWRLAQVAASPLDRSVALGDAAGRLALYREGGPKPLQVLRDAGPAVRGLAFMPDGKALVVRSDNGFQIWGLADQPSR